MTWTKDNTLMIAFALALVWVGAGLFYSASKSCDVSIDYDVTVDSFSNATPNVLEIKFACLKLYIDEFSGQSNYFDTCTTQCEALDK